MRGEVLGVSWGMGSALVDTAHCRQPGSFQHGLSFSAWVLRSVRPVAGAALIAPSSQIARCRSHRAVVTLLEVSACDDLCV